MFSVGINELQSLANASGGKKASHLQVIYIYICLFTLRGIYLFAVVNAGRD